jgi:hypothetical protein
MALMLGIVAAHRLEQEWLTLSRLLQRNLVNCDVHITRFLLHRATCFTVEELGFDLYQGRELFLFSTVSRVAFVFVSLYALCTGGSLEGVKCQGSETDHSTPSSAKVKNDGTVSHFPMYRHDKQTNSVALSPRANYTD